MVYASGKNQSLKRKTIGQWSGDEFFDSVMVSLWILQVGLDGGTSIVAIHSRFACCENPRYGSRFLLLGNVNEIDAFTDLWIALLYSSFS